jgi:hypothetical protein
MRDLSSTIDLNKTSKTEYLYSEQVATTWSALWSLHSRDNICIFFCQDALAFFCQAQDQIDMGFAEKSIDRGTLC